MKRKVSLVVFADLLFILLLAVAGSLPGIASRAFYYSAFVLPLAVALIIDKKGKEPSGKGLSFKLKGGDIPLLLPLIPLTVGAVFIISLLTTLLLNAVNLNDNVALEGEIWLLLLVHALLPAALEEGLFRYLPLKLLGERSPYFAVVLSALLFGLAHTNIFQLPYAVFAGTVFALLDLSFNSIWPSFIIHLINNICSVFWILNFDDLRFASVYATVIVAMFLLSAIIVAANRKKYRRCIAPLKNRGEGYTFGAEFFAFLILALFLGFTNLFI